MQSPKVIKRILKNGLTVLVVPRNNIPKVSVQLWYNVGSKDEKSGQKGIAHLIEHMIFKGTEKLSESDINVITHKLSGYCNAFTSYDYTGYLFDFPTQNWNYSLPIMADCMRNCTFNQEFLNSELQAVIQELKMYKDDYISSILEYTLSAVFSDHPYHHPIIGYKQDLWSLSREALVDFYKYHYVPNNATLVIVGDVDSEEVFNLTKQNFESISANLNYKKDEFYHSPDLRNYSVEIFRDIKQPQVIISWLIPGARQAKDYLIEIVSWIIGSGKGSRLYKKLVDELQLVTELDVFNYDLFDHGLFFVYFEPKDINKTDYIISIINQELQNIYNLDINEIELTRAIKKTEVEYLEILEDNQKQAYEIGKYFLATGDENYLYNFTQYPKENLKEEVKDFIKKHLRPSILNKAKILPILESEKTNWLELQKISDQEDAKILAGKSRSLEVEEPKSADNYKALPNKIFDFPKSATYFISNGLKVISYNNPQLPKIDLILDLKTKYYSDPEDKLGLSSFVANMLQEGTKNYTSEDFAQILESYGMSLSAQSGMISLSMLSSDLPKGLELLNEILTQAIFNTDSIEKVRAQMIVQLEQFWDQPSKFINQLAKDNIYKNHQYGKNVLGNIETIKKITQVDLMDYYKKYINPRGARLSIVGDLERYDIPEVIEHMLNTWQGQEIHDLEFPVINPVINKEINYPIIRDQVVLAYAGLSVSRLNPDFDKLLLFDQIFTGGVLGSMASRLFDLREQSGLFYTIGGSLLSRSDEQPGLIMIKTIVSNDRLNEAESAIENVINTAIDNVDQEEFDEAKRAVINSLVDNFSSNFKIAATFLFKDKFQLPIDYFKNRHEQLNSISINHMQEVVRKYLNTSKLIKIRAGRI